MGKIRKKTIVAGPLVYEAVYPLPSPRDSGAVRQGKKESDQTKNDYIRLEVPELDFCGKMC